LKKEYQHTPTALKTALFKTGKEGPHHVRGGGSKLFIYFRAKIFEIKIAKKNERKKKLEFAQKK
jgi:hypothetical protein